MQPDGSKVSYYSVTYNSADLLSGTVPPQAAIK